MSNPAVARAKFREATTARHVATPPLASLPPLTAVKYYYLLNAFALWSRVTLTRIHRRRFRTQADSVHLSWPPSFKFDHGGLLAVLNWFERRNRQTLRYI